MPPKSPKELLNELGDGEVLALDVGDKRIGVARGHTIARLPEPLEVVINDEMAISNIYSVICSNNTSIVVVGLPRNQSGEETSQSAKIREFVAKLDKEITQPIILIDESLTSIDADNFLKNNKNAKFAQDSVAACYILTEFFNQC